MIKSDDEFATESERYDYEIESIGDNLLNAINRADGTNVCVCRMYLNDKLLIMDTGKYQWNNVAADKNALHNQIENMLIAEYPKGWWKIKQDVFDVLDLGVDVEDYEG